MIIAFDSETSLIRPGCLAPELACITHASDNAEPGIIHHTECKGWLLVTLTAGHSVVGQNIAYDMAVLLAHDPRRVVWEAVFAAYDEGRIHDTMIREQLLDIARGKLGGSVVGDGVWIKRNYSLADLARRLLGVHLEKDEFRLTYGHWRNFPLSEWPEGAIRYAVLDASTTLAVFNAQEAHGMIADEAAQTKYAFALHLMSVHGIRTDGPSVAAFRGEVDATYNELKASLTTEGLIRANGTRNTKAAQTLMVEVCAEKGLQLRKTKADGICLDADACEVSGDDLLRDYALFSSFSYVHSKDLPMLESGTDTPISTRFGLATTGRTTSSAPNLQNLRGIKGIRECFVPRPGYVFAQADYDGLELRTLAQACFTMYGFSKLREELNAGRDVHLALAAQMLGMTYEAALAAKKTPEVQEKRKLAKVANFGFPGGLGAKGMRVYAARKPYRMNLTLDQVQALRAAWLATWPEMNRHFQWASDGDKSRAPVKQLFSGRIRGGTTYTDRANTIFQGLGADATKNALWLITKACYLDKCSPLFGSRPVMYVHDEFLVEVLDNEHAHDAAKELERLMILGASAFLPDVPATTEPLLMALWSKEAEPLYDAAGRLVVWGRK